MRDVKTYRFSVQSPHFLFPITIKAEVGETESWSEVLDTIAKEATAEWMQSYPEYFDNLTAPDFYETLSILMYQEAKANV